MFPNQWSELTPQHFEILESIMVSNISHRNSLGRTPTREYNPYGKYFQNTPQNWSSRALDTLYNDSTSLKVVGVNYLMGIGEDNGKLSLVNRRFNVSAGDVKDIFNGVYGYSLTAPGVGYITQSYLDFKMGSPLPKDYLEKLLEDLQLCPLLQSHRRIKCSNFHEDYKDLL